MLVHNRTTTVALLVAAGAVVLLGFGCDGAKTPPETTWTDVSGVTWTTYESPTLGIRVPYPEGWYVEESEGGSATDFFRSAPPALSDALPEAWAERETGTIDNAVANIEIVSREVVTRDGRPLTKVVFLEDAYQSNPNVLLYLWEDRGHTYQIGGPNRDLVEYMINHLEVPQ